MRDNVSNSSVASGPNEKSTANDSGKSGASTYLIPALGGAIIWFGLLGFGLNEIYSMGDNKLTKPIPKTASLAPVKYAVPNEKAPSSKPDNGIEATSRFAIEMQDDQGHNYTVYLNSTKETPSVQPSSSTIGTVPGDKLFHGNYDSYVSPTGSSEFKKQAVTMLNMTFNLNRKQVYVLKGNPQLLVVTQPNSANGVMAHYYTMISGVLTPVDLVRGSDTKTQLFMMAMKANPKDRTFVTSEYNTTTKHWHLTTWKADPNNKVLRATNE